jgi:hypothetical protein
MTPAGITLTVVDVVALVTARLTGVVELTAPD